MADQDDKKNVPTGDLEPLTPPEKPAEEEPVELSKDSKDILKEFDTNLEVAAMPESNELQERRRKTKNRLKELADVKDEPSEGFDEGEAFENTEGGFMDLLKEANVSKKQVGYCCGGVLVLLLLAGLVYGGIQAWTAWQNRPDKPEPDEGTEEPAEPDENGEVSTYPDPSLKAGIMVGSGDEDASEGDTGTELGEELGTAPSSEDEFTQLIADFSLMYEAMETDVNELLNRSTDRQEAYDDYEQNLNYLLYVGKQNSEVLIGQSSALVDEYENLELQREEQEALFFDRLRNLDSYASNAALESYVALGQQVVELRAQYQARQKLLSYYQLVIGSMSNRVEDIKLNEEALVKGIKVVDIEGSDIDLIIPESEL